MSTESEAVKRRVMSEDGRKEQLTGVVKEPKGGRAALEGEREALGGRAALEGEGEGEALEGACGICGHLQVMAVVYVSWMSGAASSRAECGFIVHSWPPAEHGLAMEELVGARSADLRHDRSLCYHRLPGAHRSLSAGEEEGQGPEEGEGEGVGLGRERERGQG